MDGHQLFVVQASKVSHQLIRDCLLARRPTKAAFVWPSRIRPPSGLELPSAGRRDKVGGRQLQRETSAPIAGLRFNRWELGELETSSWMDVALEFHGSLGWLAHTQTQTRYPLLPTRTGAKIDQIGTV